jgi:membrane fusion protein
MDEPSTPLFRSPAIAARRAPLLGEALLPMSLPQWCAAGFAIVVAGALAALIAFGELPRRATARGWLVPGRGTITVIAPHTATAVAVHVAEGDQVAAGAALVQLGALASTASSQDLAASDRARLVALREQLVVRERATTHAARAALERIAEREAAARGALVRLEDHRQLARQRAALAEARAADAARLAAVGALARAQAAQLLEAALALRAELLEVEGEAARETAALAELVVERRAARAAAAQRRAELEAESLRLAQEASELAARREAVVRAPIAGTATAIAVREGQAIDGGQRLLTLLPTGALLEARVLVATRDAGRLALGAEVTLRLDAFPHQRFGVLRGRVVELARSTVLPHDPDLAIAIDGPAYPVRVALAAQEIGAYGVRWPLRAGLTLDADLIVERTALWQRLLEPLRAAGRGVGR